MINAQDWYCFLGDDDTRVWSSAVNTFVAPDDPGFEARKGPGCPGKIGTEPELWEVMQNQAPGFLPEWLFDGTTFILRAAGVFSKTQLRSYAAAVRWQKETGGLTLASGMPIMSDDRAQAKINGVRIAVDGGKFPGSQTTPWLARDNQIYPLNSAAIIAMSDELQVFINQCFVTLQQMADGIEAGTITSPAQIDAAFA